MHQFTLNFVLNMPTSIAYAAFHDPELLFEWMAPGDCMVSQVANNFAEGGRYRIKMLEPTGGEMSLTGEYVSIVEDEKLEFSWAWEDNHEESIMTHVDVTFKQVNEEAVEVTLVHSGFMNEQERDQHQYGWMSCLEKLAQLSFRPEVVN